MIAPAGAGGGRPRDVAQITPGADGLALRSKGGRLHLVTRVLCLLALSLSLSSAACIPSGELVAADGGHRLLARDPQTGISVVLTTGAWQGIPSDLDDQVTVLHVLIANLGTNTIRLAPGDFDLVDERGFRRKLQDVGGSFVVQGQQDGGYNPGRSLEFERMEWTGGDIGASALPWGMLLPGTSMRGYLYFDRVDRQGNAATLTWHVYDQSGRSLVDLAFDLFVARSR